MSESTEQSAILESSQTKNNASIPEQPIVEIDLGNLTDTQKIVLVSVPVVLVIQLFYLFNMNLLTDFFKGIITGASYKPIADYVKDFVTTFVPYLGVIFLFFALYSGYILLLNDQVYLKELNKLYFYLFVALFVDFVLFFMSVSTLDPYTTEFFLFLFVLLVSVMIAFIPFGLYDLLEERTKKSTSTN